MAATYIARPAGFPSYPEPWNPSSVTVNNFLHLSLSLLVMAATYIARPAGFPSYPEPWNPSSVTV